MVEPEAPNPLSIHGARVFKACNPPVLGGSWATRTPGVTRVTVAVTSIFSIEGASNPTENYEGLSKKCCPDSIERRLPPIATKVHHRPCSVTIACSPGCVTKGLFVSG